MVDSRTIAASAGLNSGSNTDTWAEQTYGVAGALAADGSGGTTTLGASGAAFGGKLGDVSDDASSLLTAEHITVVTTSGSDVSGIDSGFSFNVVTGIRDGDDVSGLGRSIQGSFRQFADNADAIAGANVMRFVPTVATNTTDGSGGDWWTIQLASNLGLLTDDATTMDGTALSFTDGTTIVNTNAATFGGGSVGVGADGIAGTGDDATLTAFSATELELIGLASAGNVINSSGDDFTLGDFAVRKLSDGTTISRVIYAHGADTNLHDNLIGVSADGTAYNTTGTGDNLLSVTSTGAALITHNYFDVADSSILGGITLAGSTGAVVSENQMDAGFRYGIGAYADNLTVSNNLIDGTTSQYGIGTFYGPYTNVTIENNTIRNTLGYSAISAGFGSSNVTIRYNHLENNALGIQLHGDSGAFDDAQNIVISMNSIHDTTANGIELVGTAANDGALIASLPNQAIDHPIITTANLLGGNLTLGGYVGTAPGDTDFANARIEFFESDGGGEGQTYLGFLTTDASGNYSGTLAVTGVIDTDKITATATLTGVGTSEFGNEFDVNVAPVITAPGAQTPTEDTPHAISGLSVGDADTNVTSVQLTVANATLSVTLQGAASISAGASGSATLTISGTQADINSTLATLSYLGDLNFRSSDTLSILATDAGGLTDSDSVSLNVSAVNDDPYNAGSLPSNISVTEDVLGDVDLSAISLQDHDDAGLDLTVKLTTATGGNLYATTGGGVTVAGNGSGVMTLTGSQGDLNTFLNTASNIQYLHGTNHTNGNNADTITVVFNDNGNTGSGGGTDISIGTVDIDIVSVNDAPVVTTNSDFDDAGNEVINFEGGDDAITLSGLPVNTTAGTEVTVEFWMNWDGVSVIMPFGFDGYNLYFQSGALGFNSSAGDIYGISAAGLSGGWHHVAAVFHNGDVQSSRLMLDGVEQILTQQVGTPNNTNAFVTSDASISGWPNTAGFRFDGRLDEVRIWNGSRSEAEVQSLMHDQISGPHDHLVANYSFSGAATGAGGVTDNSGNGHHGTMVGMTAANVTTSHGFADFGDTLTYSENDGAVTLHSNVSIVDVDHTDLAGATIQITGGFVTGEDTLAFSNQNGITGAWDSATGTLTLAGTATVDQYETALRSITYANTSEMPDEATRTVSWSVDDGSDTSLVSTSSIDITSVNDNPFADSSLPTDITVTEDVSSNVDLSSLNLADVDDNGGDFTVTLNTSAGGLLSAISAGGVTIGGTGTPSLTLTGSKSAINIYLNDAAKIQYLHPTTHLNGNDADTITVLVNDGGNTGSGGGTDINFGSVNIDITNVNDAPTILDSDVVNLTGTNEDTVSSHTNVDSIVSSASWNDADAGPKGLAVTGLSGNGTWQYSTDGTNWTSFGAVSTSNAMLLSASAEVRYLPDLINGETATFSFVGWDMTTDTASTSAVSSFADPGVGGGTTAYSTQSATASIVVTSVNDAVVAVPDADTATEAGGVANATAGTNPTGNVLTNDTDPDTGDTLNVVGVASGTVALASGNVASSVTGTYGSLTIAADGSYTYAVDNDNSIVQALLSSGQTITDTFTYTVEDSGSATSSTQVVITIEGANDAPVSVTDDVTATEAGGIANASVGSDPTGNVLSNDTDVDSGDTKTIAGVVAGIAGSASGNVASSVTGTYGAITINANGSFTYTVDNNNAAVEALRSPADTLNDVFTYTMTDTDGEASTTQVTVTIEGQNDDPGAVDDNATATVEAGGVANGAAGTNSTGNVLTNDTDIDTGDTQAVTGVAAGSQANAAGSVGSGVVGSYGSITIASDGSYIYTVDNTVAAVEALRTSSDTLSEVFTYTMQDAASGDSTAEITVTITGANDAPIAVANTATAIEESGINNNISGTDPTGNVITNDTDVDAGDTKTVTGVALGTQSSTSGSVGVTVAGTYGSIVINADGTYTYTVDNSNATVEALNDGESLSETFSYTIDDTAGLDSTTQIVITIDGRTDQPVAEADQDTSVESGGVANASAGTNPSGNVLANDASNNGKMVIGVDPGTTGTASGDVGTSVTGSYGSIVIDANGDYTYTLDNTNTAVEALLTSGDHVTDIFTYTMEDAFNNISTTQVTITVDGTNDAPIGVDDNGIAVESGGVNNATAGSDATGNVVTNDTDVDAGDTKMVVGVVSGAAGSASGSVSASVTGVYGSVVINADGSYTYTVDENNSTVRSRRTASETLSEIFTYSMQDTAGAETTATLTVTIQGANDAPGAVLDTAMAFEAGGVNNASTGTDPTGNVLTNDTDVDYGDTQTVTGVVAGTQGSASGNVATSVAGAYGSITIAADGSYTFVVDNNNAAVQSLRTSGETLDDAFTYTMQDTDGLVSTTQITVTVHGANDHVDVIFDSATAVEAGGTANGTGGTDPTGNVLTNDSDVDTGDTMGVSGVAAGVLGSATGNVGASVAGLYGSINIASDGGYTYMVDNANATVQDLLSSSDTLTEIFTYSVQDAAGGESTTQITITIEGANDAPVAFANYDDATEAGGINNGTAGTDPTGNVLSNDDQVDAGDTWAITGVAQGIAGSTSGSVGSGVAGSFGSITIASDGSYTYNVDNNNATVQALRTSSDTLTDVFSYTVDDGTGLDSTTQITITLHGVNDAPDAVVDNATAVEAGGLANGTSGTDPTGNVLTNDTDIDTGDSKNISGVAAGVQASTTGSVGGMVTGSYGSINIDSNGNYTYTVDNANATVEALRLSSDTLDDVFTYTMIDADGATSTTQITVTIQGQNDDPGAVDDTATAMEAGGVSNGTAGTDPTGNVLTNDTDIDSGDTKTITGVAAGSQANATGSVATSLSGAYGAITLNTDGSYTYVVDNSNATVQALRTSSDTLSDVFTYTMQDTAGIDSTAELTVTIQGQNDDPIAVVDTATAVEAGGDTNGTAGTNPTGNVLTNDTDVDSGDTKTVAGVVAGIAGSASGGLGSSIDGSYGAITMNTNGSYNYIVDNNNAAVQALLTSSDTLDDVFTYTMTDTDGATSTTQITVTIQGQNDDPGAVDDTATAMEAGGVANGTVGTDPTGNVLTNDTDVDAGDTQTITGVATGSQPSASGSVATSVTGTYGTVTINADGSYTYVVDNTNATVQALQNGGSTIDDVFTYTMEDAAGIESTAEITVTIEGQNDAPVIISDGGGATAAINVLETVDTVTTVMATDADGDTPTFTITGGVDASDFTITGGVLQFVITPDFELPVDDNGDNVYLVQVTASDGNGGFDIQDLTITVIDVISTLTVTTTTDNNDSGIIDGDVTHTTEWLNAHKGTDGEVSLREAIIAANNTTGTDTVTFGLSTTDARYFHYADDGVASQVTLGNAVHSPGLVDADFLTKGWYSFDITTALPDITDSIIIDGTTQGEFVDSPIIELVASGDAHDIAGTQALNLFSDDNTVRGLVIRNFGGNLVRIRWGSEDNTHRWKLHRHRCLGNP